jgi:hypothetical protein
MINIINIINIFNNYIVIYFLLNNKKSRIKMKNKLDTLHIEDDKKLLK